MAWFGCIQVERQGSVGYREVAFREGGSGYKVELVNVIGIGMVSSVIKEKEDLRLGLRLMRKAVGRHYFAYACHGNWFRFNRLLSSELCCAVYWEEFDRYSESEGARRDRLIGCPDIYQSVYADKFCAFEFIDTPQGFDWWAERIDKICYKERKDRKVKRRAMRERDG